MEILLIIGAILLGGLLFAACFWGGPAIIESIRRSQKKNWGSEAGDHEEEKKTFRFYVICFFAGLPILLIAALFLQ